MLDEVLKGHFWRAKYPLQRATQLMAHLEQIEDAGFLYLVGRKGKIEVLSNYPLPDSTHLFPAFSEAAALAMEAAGATCGGVWADEDSTPPPAGTKNEAKYWKGKYTLEAATQVMARLEQIEGAGYLYLVAANGEVEVLSNFTMPGSELLCAELSESTALAMEAAEASCGGTWADQDDAPAPKQHKLAAATEPELAGKSDFPPLRFSSGENVQIES